MLYDIFVGNITIDEFIKYVNEQKTFYNYTGNIEIGFKLKLPLGLQEYFRNYANKSNTILNYLCHADSIKVIYQFEFKNDKFIRNTIYIKDKQYKPIYSFFKKNIDITIKDKKLITYYFLSK